MKCWSKQQWRILAGCVVAYTGAYICRLNMSALVPELITDFGLSVAQTGLIITLFSVAYAAGQLVSGLLSDRMVPLTQILLGLTVSVLCNAIVALCNHYAIICCVWMINGLGQSMIWTPIILLVAEYFDEKERQAASFILSGTMVVGHLVAWGVSGMIANAVGWRMSFGFSAALTACFALSAALMLRAVHVGRRARGAAHASRLPISALLRDSSFVTLLIVCASNGYVRDSVLNWTPTILWSDGSDSFASLVVPFINIIGLVGGGLFLSRLHGRTRVATGTLFALCMASIIPLIFAGHSTLVSAIMLGITYAIMYACNPILTTLIPMEYEYTGRAGFCAGIMDCAIYVGSSFSGFVVGALKDASGWENVYLSWMLAMMIGIGACLTGLSLLRNGNRVFKGYNRS